MNIYINGIGYGDDLKHTAFDESGHPIIRSGYFIHNNHIYYAFGDLALYAITSPSGIIECAGYEPGMPFFVISSDQNIETIESNIGYDAFNCKILDIRFNLLNDKCDYGWEYNSDLQRYVFKYNLIDVLPSYNGSYGGFLAFDRSQIFTFPQVPVVDSVLALGEPNNTVTSISNAPLWLQTGIYGTDLSFYAVVTNELGEYLSNKKVEWYKVYTKPYGVPPSGVGVGDSNYPSGVLPDEQIVLGPYGDNMYEVLLYAGSSVTDAYGTAIMNISFEPFERDVFVYASCESFRSNLIWVCTLPSVSDVTGTFQTNDTSSYIGSIDAYTAIGLDKWNIPMASGQMDNVATEEPPGIYVHPNGFTYTLGVNIDISYIHRGGWRLHHQHYTRPPSTEISFANEPNGTWSIHDFLITYDPTRDLTEFARNQRCAVLGYWGQVVVTGSDIRNDPDWKNNNSNSSDTRYIIDYKTSPTSGYEEYNGYYVKYGSLDDVYNNSQYDNNLYVFYRSNYFGNNVNDVKTNTHYFRGLAVPNITNGQQDFLIEDLLTTKPLRK